MFGNLFKKKEERTPVEMLEAQHQCVIFNLLDHESVVAATLYKASTPLANVTLVDVRDPLHPADTYVWLGLGSREQLTDFYSVALMPQQLNEVMENSVFIERPGLMKKLSDLVAERSGGVEKNPLLSKWSISADLFHDNSPEIERIVRYYAALDMCHRAYAHCGDAAEELSTMTLEASPVEVEEFKEKQREINKSLARKIRFITYPTKDSSIHPFHQFTSMDSICYSLIRRCVTCNKNFLHTSMSVYGQIVYSNKRFDKQSFKHGNDAVLFIQSE